MVGGLPITAVCLKTPFQTKLSKKNDSRVKQMRFKPLLSWFYKKQPLAPKSTINAPGGLKRDFYGWFKLALSLKPHITITQRTAVYENRTGRSVKKMFSKHF